MRRLLFFNLTVILVLGTGFAKSQTTDSLTVEEAIKMAIARHPLVQQASETLQASLARVEQSRSGYYPVSDVELSYVRLAPIAQLSFPGLGKFKLYPENNYDEHIVLRQTVYDFGKTSSGVEVNKSNVELASDNVEFVKTNLAYQTAQTFYAILFLRQSILVQIRQIDVLNQHLIVAQKKAQSGTATDFDVLTTQVRIAAAQSRRLDLQNELQKQEASMARLLSMPVDAEIRLRGEFTYIPIAPNLDSLTALAKKQRIELKLAQDAEKTAELQQHAISLRDMPALKVNLAYGLKNGYIPNLDVLRGNIAVALQASIPVFNGFRTRNEEDEASANYRATAARSRDVERLILTEVQQAISDLQTNAEKIETSTLQVTQAKQAVEIAASRYESGIITNLDLIDSETALTQAELMHLEALHHYVLSRYTLEKAVGGLL
jgi:outer membrane protein